MRSVPVGFALMVLIATLAHAQGAAVQTIPGQVVEIPKLAVVVADQKCDDWAWAAALDTVLGLDGLKLGQRHWITKLHGGELCKDDFGRLEDLPALVNGEYVLDDGRKIRVSTLFQAGAPTAVDDMIVSLRGGHPMILFWKRHAYLLTAMVYDEYIGGSGDRVFVVREMTLRDPFFHSEEKQIRKFVKGTDDPTEIDGSMRVTVSPVESQSWRSKE